MLVQAAVSGVDGAIGSTYNVNGVRARQIFEKAIGNVRKLMKFNTKPIILSKMYYLWGLFVKEILASRGIDGGAVAPFKAFNKQASKLDKLIKDYNL